MTAPPPGLVIRSWRFVIRRLTTLAIAIVILFATPASSSAMTAAQKNELQRRYYKAAGVVRWIGSHARVTQYHPDARVKHRWQAAAHFWKGVRVKAYAQLHPAPTVPQSLLPAFLCIHRYEGAWNANSGNGYFGGLQMDVAFQSLYGGEFLHRWGTADRWPVWAQLEAASRAYQSGRGFYPWPNTARACGLL